MRERKREREEPVSSDFVTDNGETGRYLRCSNEINDLSSPTLKESRGNCLFFAKPDGTVRFFGTRDKFVRLVGREWKHMWKTVSILCFDFFGSYSYEMFGRDPAPIMAWYAHTLVSFFTENYHVQKKREKICWGVKRRMLAKIEYSFK